MMQLKINPCIILNKIKGFNESKTFYPLRKLKKVKLINYGKTDKPKYLIKNIKEKYNLNEIEIKKFLKDLEDLKIIKNVKIDNEFIEFEHYYFKYFLLNNFNSDCLIATIIEGFKKNKYFYIDLISSVETDVYNIFEVCIIFDSLKYYEAFTNSFFYLKIFKDIPNKEKDERYFDFLKNLKLFFEYRLKSNEYLINFIEKSKENFLKIKQLPLKKVKSIDLEKLKNLLESDFITFPCNFINNKLILRDIYEYEDKYYFNPYISFYVNDKIRELL